MKFATLLSFSSLATLAYAVPTNENSGNEKEIPWSAFPVSSTPIMPIPLPTSTPTQTPTSNSVGNLGRAMIVNHCNVPIYIWSVGSTIRPQATVLPYGRFSETYRHDPESGGIALKISSVHDGLYTSSPMTVFAYNLAGDSVWFDLSDVFGDPFAGHPVTLDPAEPQIYWQNGVPPSGSMVRVRDASGDLILTLC
ncbi:Antigenic thaumatin-like protein [Penicillium sp. IBT 18751x]|nr:Antigenic thaumatin-like protein [Penicillium sp. IBT 18751x]